MRRMAGALDASRKLNLERISVLALEQSVFSRTILSQMLRGFGVKNIHSPRSAADALITTESSVFDLIVVDPTFDAGGGLEFARLLRRASGNKNRFAPMILAIGHSTKNAVGISRDAGANLVLSKPFAPKTLLERILWAAADKRPYVEVGAYVGPDRRFKDEGLPGNPPGMRASDQLRTSVGTAGEPSQPPDQSAE
jgi:CheY-like chemotaxis protein